VKGTVRYESGGYCKIGKKRMMVRWMCSVHSRTASAELNSRVIDVLRLRWFGRVERNVNDDWVSACRSSEVKEVRYRGRGKKTLN